MEVVNEVLKTVDDRNGVRVDACEIIWVTRSVVGVVFLTHISK